MFSETQKHHNIKNQYKKYFFVNLLFVLFVLAGVISAGKIIYNLKNNQLVQLELLHKASVNIIEGHLWLEEIVEGDTNEDYLQVKQRLDRAEDYLFLLKNGGVYQKTVVAPIDNKKLENKLLLINKLLNNFSNTAYQRYATPEMSQVGSQIDQRFDDTFEELLKELSLLQMMIKATINRDIFAYFNLSILLACMILAFFILFNFIIYRFEKEKIFILHKLLDNNKVLEQKEAELRDQNDQLKIQEEALLQKNDELAAQEEELQNSNEDLKQTIDELEKVRDSYAMLISSMNEAFTYDKFIYDRAHNLLDSQKINVNEAFEKMFNMKKVDIIGKRSSELFKDFNFSAVEEYKALHKNGRTVQDTYIEKLGKYIRISAYRIGEDEFAAIIQDITSEVKLKQELTSRGDLLEDKVRERTEELQTSLKNLEETNFKLKEANFHKNRFLSIMSHELRTPLNAILGFADLLDKQYYGNLNKQQIEYVSLILNSGQHLLELINDILDIAKIDAGSMETMIEEINIKDCLNAIYNMMKPQFEDKNIELDFNTEEAISLLYTDIRKCKQVIINLLSNALKFTPEGGHVSLQLESVDETYMKISVTDNGIGIKQEDQERVFSEFCQLDNSIKDVLGGAGIGLALSKRLVHLLGGDIGVNSTLGAGSTFWFTFKYTPELQD